MVRVVQIAAVLLLIAVLTGIRHGIDALLIWGGPDFTNGFMIAMLLFFAMLGVILWIQRHDAKNGDDGNGY